MESMDSKGYVALFHEALSKDSIRSCVRIWLESYERVEQTCPGPHAGGTTLTLTKEEDILWEQNLQFRVLSGEDFAWIYVSPLGRVMETSGLPYADNTLPLDVLIDLPDLEEVIDQENDRRLDQLEAEGLL